MTAPITKPQFHGDCDCCGNNRPQLFRVVAYGIETFICAACCENDDATDGQNGGN